MASSTFKAIMCETISATAKEGIEAVALIDLPRKLVLADGEVRISVKSVSINFPELLMLQNKYQYKPKLLFVMCTEGAGIVVEVGRTVTRYKNGDHVIFASMAGCACEELVLFAEDLHHLPATLSFSQGAGFLMGYTTGYHALIHRGRLQAGEWLLVTGAGGGMGLMAVQLGKALGAKVIAAASSDDKLEICQKVGADYVINYTKRKLKDAVGDITNGAFCDVIYEPVGGEIFDQCVRCVASGGYARLLVIGFASGTIPKFPTNLALIKGFDLVGVRMGAQMGLQPNMYQEMIQNLLMMASDGKLTPYVGAEFGLDRYKDAFSLMEEKRVIGKCCISFGGGSKL